MKVQTNPSQNPVSQGERNLLNIKRANPNVSLEIVDRPIYHRGTALKSDYHEKRKHILEQTP